MKSPQTKWDAATIAAVAMHFEAGTGVREISRILFVPPATLSRWKNDGFPATHEAGGTVEQANETPEHERGTPEQTNGTSEEETAKIAVFDSGDAVPHVPFAQRSTFFERHFSLMDFVFYLTTGTACYAIWNTLPNVFGLSFLTVYALFSLDSLLAAKNAALPKAAEYAGNRVIVSELVAAVAHFSICNKLLWQNTAALPFEVKEVFKNGVWQTTNSEAIFYISCTIAALMFFAAYGAVDAVLNRAKEAAAKSFPK